MSSSASPPSCSNRTSSDVTALVAELARVIKGRRFYGPGSAPLARLFERALRAWQAELTRHGDLELQVGEDGLRVPGLPATAFAGEFSTLRAMLAQRGVRSLRVEASLDADGFAALLEVLVSDAAKLTREGGVESALYARAPVGFIVNGNPPQALAPAAPAEPASPAQAEPASPAQAEPASPAQAEPASPARTAAAAGKLSTELMAEIAQAEAALVVPPTALPPAPREREDAVPSAPALPALAEPEPDALEGAADEPAADLAEPPATDPTADPDLGGVQVDGAEPSFEPEPDSTEATDPDATLALNEEAAPAFGADPEWGQEVGFEPPPAVAHDALPPIPSSLLPPESAVPTSEGFAAPPAQPELAPSFGQDEPEEEITTPAFQPSLEREPQPEFAALAPAGLAAQAVPDEETTSPAFADELAFEDSPFLGTAADAPAAGPSPSAARAAALDFGGEPLEFDLAGEEGGEIETDLGFAADRFPTDGPLEFEDTSSAPDPAPASRTVRPADPSAGGVVGDLLRDLDDCTEGMVYRELAERAANAAEKLAAEGLENDAYVVLRALVSHASDESKRPAEQREAANDHLRRLATGPLLETLLGRACGEGDGSLEANQILVQLGSDAVVPVFRAAALERSAERRERLHGVLIAMGDEALPDLLRLMRDDDPGQARSAVRLAGELQNPAAVGRLSELLESPSNALSQEVSKALVRIGDTTAIRTLSAGLDSPVSHVPSITAYALGASGSDFAVEALLGALHRSIVHGKTEFAREVIRSLGRLGRAEATPDLAAILLRRGLRQRRRHRELKLAAASALGRLPGDEAVGALAQAAQSRDAHIRRAAQIALDRRAQALAGPHS